MTAEAELALLHDRSTRAALGQFFTPPAIAEFMAAALGSYDSVLDPAVGGGVLLRAARASSARFGLDIDPDAVALARASLGHNSGAIAQGDFLDERSWPFGSSQFDAIIANPPYLRHHRLSPAVKSLAGTYSRDYGIRVSALSGSYVYFFLEAYRHLRPGGRLVFITPVEYLDARYGAPLKEFLLRLFQLEEIVVLDMDELAFDGVLTTSAITIATRRTTGTKAVRLTEARYDGRVTRLGQTTVSADQLRATPSWTQALPSRARAIQELSGHDAAQLSDVARVRRGIASADNSYFCLTDDAVRQWMIEPQFLVPVVVGSRDLPLAGTLTHQWWDARKAAGARVWLLWCHLPPWALHGTNVLRYIRHGEELGVQHRFNARSRQLWYGVESVPPADYFVTYMARDRARVIRNDMGARCMTSLLNVWVNPGVNRDLFDSAVTDWRVPKLIRAFGRTYGGGLGKLEPSDLMRLPLPLLRRPLDEAV